MIEFFSGLVAVLMWLPFSFLALVQGVYLNVFDRDVYLAQVSEPGIVFSFKQAELLGLNPREVFLNLLDELKPGYLRVIAYWDRIESEKDRYNFSELDFQLIEAEKRKIKTTLVVGEKVPRWPECHYPNWFSGLDSQAEKQKQTTEYLELLINRYENTLGLELWQLENEPFLDFGECPKVDTDFFKQKLSLLKGLSSKPVMVTASGELDSWLRAFVYGDQIGFSIYRRFFVSLPKFRFGLDYPLPPRFYKIKSEFFRIFFKKPVMVTEFQLEPWLQKTLKDASLEDQFKELSFEKFGRQVDYAQKTGIKRIYFWGSEWWWYLKQNNHPEFLDYVRKNIFLL